MELKPIKLNTVGKKLFKLFKLEPIQWNMFKWRNNEDALLLANQQIWPITHNLRAPGVF